jgi:hypothetical protein
MKIQKLPFFFLAIGLFACIHISAIAQVIVEEKKDGEAIQVNLNEKEDVEMIQLVGMTDLFYLVNHKIKIYVDYGQKLDLKNDSYVIGKDGKKIKFFTMIQALNYCLQNRWEYVGAYALALKRQNVFYYTLRKKN